MPATNFCVKVMLDPKYSDTIYKVEKRESLVNNLSQIGNGFEYLKK